MMKLRVRIHSQTSRVELLGADPSLKELIDHIREVLLPAHGLSSDCDFSLSLNGSELLTDGGQSLSSCSIVSGDLISVLLPRPEPDSPSSSRTSSSTDRTSSSSENRHSAAMTTNQPGSSSSGGHVGPAAASLTHSSDVSSHLSDPGEPSGPDSGPGPGWEPMLCSEAEDGRAPLSLELLHHSAQTSSPSEAVMVVTHLLMLETGFVPQGGLRPGEMPSGWRSPSGLHRLQYSHPLCEHSVITVLGVCMGPVLVINATLQVNESVDTVRKLCVNPSSYVTDRWTEGAAAAFTDLNKLSRLFKDQLLFPLIAAAREVMALPVALGLAALPPELFLRVVRLLDVVSVVRLSSVCRTFNTSANDSSLWRHLYRRDFSDRGLSRSRDTDWRDLYRRCYKARSDRRRHMTPPLCPPWDIFNPLPAPLHPPLPGIIGGEYDQRPGLPRILLPRPRYDPIGPPQHPHLRNLDGGVARPRGAPGGRAADIRRGFI